MSPKVNGQVDGLDQVGANVSRMPVFSSRSIFQTQLSVSKWPQSILAPELAFNAINTGHGGKAALSV